MFEATLPKSLQLCIFLVIALNIKGTWRGEGGNVYLLFLVSRTAVHVYD